MAETVMDPATEEEKQLLQSEGAEQREGENFTKRTRFLLREYPTQFHIIVLHDSMYILTYYLVQ